VAEDGRVLTAGLGAYGQLGHGNTKNETHLKVVEGPLKNTQAKLVACGAYHTAIVTSEYI
jgi:alpha-tubulin suppressor-like RCC1 family protein